MHRIKIIVLGLILSVITFTGCNVDGIFVANQEIPEQLKQYIVSSDKHHDQNIIFFSTPGRPPKDFRAPIITLPSMSTKSSRSVISTAKVLDKTPAFDWSYGCAPTAAAMLAGYYDNIGYDNIYTGPINGGIVPMNNLIWGNNECPLSATHQGFDGRSSRGHVDDYWVDFDEKKNDPFTNNWDEHVYENCTADYMGTSQDAWNNSDGSTVFVFNTSGYQMNDCTFVEDETPKLRDGCHGLKLFYESRGYTVTTNYNQWIEGIAGNTKGFTFDQYKAEIDAGHPVLIHVAGHTMLGFGYDSSLKTVYLHDTWDMENHSMVWGTDYHGLQHFGVSVVHLQPLNQPQTQIASIKITQNFAGYNKTEPFTWHLLSSQGENLGKISQISQSSLGSTTDETFALTSNIKTGQYFTLAADGYGDNYALPAITFFDQHGNVIKTLNISAKETDILRYTSFNPQISDTYIKFYFDGQNIAYTTKQISGTIDTPTMEVRFNGTLVTSGRECYMGSVLTQTGEELKKYLTFHNVGAGLINFGSTSTSGLENNPIHIDMWSKDSNIPVGHGMVHTKEFIFKERDQRGIFKTKVTFKIDLGNGYQNFELTFVGEVTTPEKKMVKIQVQGMDTGSGGLPFTWHKITENGADLGPISAQSSKRLKYTEDETFILTANIYKGDYFVMVSSDTEISSYGKTISFYDEDDKRLISSTIVASNNMFFRDSRFDTCPVADRYIRFYYDGRYVFSSLRTNQ